MTTLKDIGEFGLIDRIQGGCIHRPERVRQAIGDDAAVVMIPPAHDCLITTDMLIEGIHFIRDTLSAEDLGYKSLAVNLSDIAAMGAEPESAYISLGIPPDCSTDYIEEMYDGIKGLAREFGVNVLGGDTTGSKHDLIINITLLGAQVHTKILYRNAAKAGDFLCLTGTVGASRAGLELILNKKREFDAVDSQLIMSHFRPVPHVHEGLFLAEQNGTHAAIDISDGLAQDLGHIGRESSVGFYLEAEALPGSEVLRDWCSNHNRDIIDYMLAGGEDYVLACTIAPDAYPDIAYRFKQRFGRPLHKAGVVTSQTGLTVKLGDGRSMIPDTQGWDHFSK